MREGKRLEVRNWNVLIKFLAWVASSTRFEERLRVEGLRGCDFVWVDNFRLRLGGI